MIDRILILSGLFGATLLLQGCKPETVATGPKNESSASAPIANDPVKTPEVAEPKASEIAADLKSAGYMYFGLDNAKSQKFTQTGGPGGEQEAGQQTSYLGMKDGAPTFKISRTGATATIGDSELIVRKDGLYTSSVGGQKLDKPSLEVPADLAPGRKWTSNSSFSLDVGGKKQTISQNMAFHAVAVEKVQTKMGKFDALKVVGKGTMKAGDRAGQNDSTMWFVKSVGLVKMVSKFVSEGVEQKMTIEIVSEE